MSGDPQAGGPPPGLPERIETILLDAGGVLLDLDYGYVRRLIEARGLDVDLAGLPAAEAKARTAVHRSVLAGQRPVDLWRDYFHSMLGTIGVPGPVQSPIIDSLWEGHQRYGLWTVAIEGALEALGRLRERGYRLGVVSNAEGRVEADLASAGFAPLLETVVDSHVVEVAKPDPKIFRIALERLEADPATTVFVGDVPAVDVVGARAAGLTAVLLDPHVLYKDWNVHRITALRDLPGWLTAQGH